MANLLPRDRALEPFPPLDDPTLQTLRTRVEAIESLSWSSLRVMGAAAREGFEAELEELEEAPTLALAAALVAEMDGLRAEATGDRGASDAPSLAPATAPVRVTDWLLLRPGRSLTTGEAEIASRGFFDALDRPALSLAVAVVARPGISGTEIGLLIAVPEVAATAAEAGRAACPSGALVSVEAVAPALATQLATLRQPAR